MFLQRALSISTLFLVCVINNLQAQSINSWTVYPSFNSIKSLHNSGNEVIVQTNGGVFFADGNNISLTLSTIDGLHQLNGISSDYYQQNGKLVIGYSDGVIDIIDVNSLLITTLRDIERVEEFNSKRINDVVISDDLAYLATDFGIVILDIERELVVQSILAIGDFSRGIAVNSIDISADRIIVGTEQGLLIANLNTDLQITQNWQSFELGVVLPDSEINDVIFIADYTYSIIDGQLYRLDENNNWNADFRFNSSQLVKLQVSNSSLIAFTQNRIFIDQSPNVVTFSTGSYQMNSVEIFENEVWVGSNTNGIIRFDANGVEQGVILPNGPSSNDFKGLNLDGEILISSTTNKSARNSSIDIAKGYHILGENNWNSYNRTNNETLNSFGFQQAFTSTISENYYYFGAWGRGIARHHKETNTIDVFDETNSTIRGWVDDNPLFPVISGLATDSEDGVWAVSRYGSTPLYYQASGENVWLPFSPSSAVSNQDEYLGLFVDSNNQKWISLQSSTADGNGLLVLNTGDPLVDSDDFGVKLTTNPDNGNLPDNQINAIIEDKNGEVWIGADRGIARFIFPQFITSSSSGFERTAQWLINADTSATSRFLLRDINVTAMAVNGANQKWIGTNNQGLWLLNEDGSSVVEHFTKENSELLSNSILSIAVNDANGEVFIATDQGLISYVETAKGPAAEMEELEVFPNPFVYQRHERIIIDELSQETIIRIVGSDGSVVHEFEANGGRVSWDARDSRGNNLASGVYFVIALGDDGSEKGMGKVVIIR